MPPKIRPMKPADMKEVSRIDGESFSDLLTKLYHTPVNLPPHEAEYLDFWRAREPKGSLVEEEDGRINGFVFCHKRGKSAWIGPLAVRVGLQGRGTGKRLMEAGLKYLDRAGAKLVGLDTFAQNPISVSLYLKFGFRLVGGLLLMEAPCEALETLETESSRALAHKCQWGPLEPGDLVKAARLEAAATGFNRLTDFEFLLDSGLGAAFAVYEKKALVGYVFASIRRGTGFIAPLHLVPRRDVQPLANLLFSMAAAWLAEKQDGTALAFCRGTDLRMLDVLLAAGFRMRSMCVTMHRPGDGDAGPIRTPYSIEKG